MRTILQKKEGEPSQLTSEPPYLYLTTLGRVTRRPHQIEIWFVVHEGCCYMVSGGRVESDWVKNLLANPVVSWRVGSRDATLQQGTARTVDPSQEPDLHVAVSRLMDVKYNWSDGLIVELKPA
jgi:deazaflavin-dependent oxidoreductase (nitroreductase family)